MPLAESVFQKMVNDTYIFYECYYSGLYNSLYKYSIELIYDGHEIPDKYIIVENRILHQFPKIYKKLAERGSLELIQKMLSLNRNSHGRKNAKYVMFGAAKAGNIEILEWMIQNKYKHYERTTAYAANANQIETLRWLIEHDFKISSFATYCAAGKGHMDILKFLVIDQNCEADAYLAAVNGQFEVVKYLYSIDPSSLRDICNGACQSDNLDILKFAYDKGGKVDEYDINCKHMHVLDWLIDNNHIQLNIGIARGLAESGNFECLQFLHHKFSVLDSRVFSRAVSGRNIEMIKWLHALGSPFDKEATRAAVDLQYGFKKRGSLIILKLLVEWGCEIDLDVLGIAARNGDLEILQYLHSLGHVLNDEVIACAATNGHLHVIIWCRKQGCGWNADACQRIVAYNHLNVLRWLRGFERDACELESDEKEICLWNEEVCWEAIRYGHVDVLKFALENGCEFSRESYESAIKFTKKIDIIDCLKDHFSAD